MPRHKTFVYTGETVPELNQRQHAAFLLGLQKAVVYSLEKRELLDPSQRARCLLELENKYTKSKEQSPN